ncbi:ubiquitin carboxyl-terminal hydrolase 48-like isoform X1 [Brevipalpus obovatus]|uniref:ubiquitin carboxyl-terminal hydrolase 48-like isoform X1 n=1 Tax=Brevipalpus obovatus TaxID=246614 RepID=UPI003D9FAD36
MNATEKLAFDWPQTLDLSTITRDQILRAYRLNLKSCSTKPNPCKRNCNSNPKCIWGLGENRLFNREEPVVPNFDEEERRPEGSFAGLKNLGATCYVNCSLQVWFHNPFFREAIYKWRPEDDEKEIAAQLNRDLLSTESTGSNELVKYNPVSAGGQLQVIFAKLQFSSKRYIDPTPFVNSLQLDVCLQQDAQEFSKLFLTLLEEELRSQKNPSVRNIIQTQYCGEYDYVTRCSNCNQEFTFPSKFYELSLNIKGHKDVHECLDEFFSPEILEGSNQYHCNVCQSKQNVVRTIRLRKCPPYLNLQLLRFIYDRQKRLRKKLNTSIKFPLTLDMKKYFHHNEKGCTEYHLCAVVVHRGQFAHSGHYIANIKDRASGRWYKFNDEYVELTPENVIKLCSDGSKASKTSAASSRQHRINNENNENTAPTSSQGPRSVSPTSEMGNDNSTVKFTKGSSNPYMLVYKIATLDDSRLPPDGSSEWDIPEYLQNVVIQDNSEFEHNLEKKKKEQEHQLAQNREAQKEILNIYKNLIVKDTEPFEWISKNWLKEWLQSDFKTPITPVDNSHALCPHNKLSLRSITSMKCVNSKGADMIFSKYGGQPRLKDALCQRCVESKARPLQVKDRLAEDAKQISQKELSEDQVFINESPNGDPCCNQMMEREMEKSLNYKDARVYVRKIQDESDDHQENGTDGEEDSHDLFRIGVTRKRLKGTIAPANTDEFLGIESSHESIRPPRRSSRRRKYRDEKEFTVSSIQTLLSLKIAIMHDFKVSPIDQDLFLNEVYLQGNDKTLADLRILPNSLIYLKIAS